MSINIPSSILEIKGQCVNRVEWNKEASKVVIHCRRDRRHGVRDPKTGQRGTVNRYVRRQVKDIPFFGLRCAIEIELAQVLIGKKERRMEVIDLVKSGSYYTQRFCRLISGLCRHMSIQTVARHFSVRWETVKNIDKAYLQATLPALDPCALQGLRYIGVDEVARAKGHDYMTVVYDLDSGQLIWVHEGRTSGVFSMFLRALPEETKAGILAVAMDMGPAYQKSVRDELPNADIIFDRFHVMQMYSKAIDNQRRVEFRKANQSGKDLIKGSRYLLLKNSEKLTDKQRKKLATLRQENENMNLIYMLKEQLQTLWHYDTYKEMATALESWCDMAEETNMIYIKKFAKSLRKHKQGICHYAKHPLTTARIEAGNVGIGLIRKRARGIRDTQYFKLKIRQLSVPDTPSMFYRKVS